MRWGDEDNLVLVDSHSSVVPDSRVGIGNGLDNVMLRNTADNVLEGGAGHDVLHGGSRDRWKVFSSSIPAATF